VFRGSADEVHRTGKKRSAYLRRRSLGCPPVPLARLHEQTALGDRGRQVVLAEELKGGDPRVVGEVGRT
jgi:hypothetical protein